jgi:hypothetical protein
MLTFALLFLDITALSVFLYLRIGVLTAGSTDVVDRDAERIRGELRAILSADRPVRGAQPSRLGR